MIDIKAAYRHIRALKWVSPGSFVLCGVTFAGVHAVLHLLGLRESTSIFCGTLPAERSEQIVAGFCGLMYTFFYMLTVLVTPILLIAAGLFWSAQRITAGQTSRPG
jgi:hypothetical protein